MVAPLVASIHTEDQPAARQSVASRMRGLLGSRPLADPNSSPRLEGFHNSTTWHGLSHRYAT